MHSKNAQHVAKLEALWFDLCQEELAVEHVQLPLSFLLDRILNILPQEMMMMMMKSTLSSKVSESLGHVNRELLKC